MNINSLGGYKLTDKFALSALADYRTTVLANFNDPGYLDIGVGVTWLPIPKMVVVIHPLNYNIVFSSSDNPVFQSSAGAKILADYNDTILSDKVSWRSSASGFFSYKSSNLHNWTWVNAFGFNAFKGIGVGFEFGLRGNKQESYNNFLTANPDVTFSDAGFDNFSDTGVQTYWLLGLSFGF